MRILIAEDDMASRMFMKKFLSKYGECDIVIDGLEAIDAYLASIKEKKPYDLICLDIMMPKFDGLKVLRTIRDMEKQNNVAEQERSKVIMVSALNDKDTVLGASDIGCDAYAWKPIETGKFIQVIKKLGLIQ